MIAERLHQRKSGDRADDSAECEPDGDRGREAAGAQEAEACHWLDSRTQACDVAIVDLFLKQGTGLGVLMHMAGYARPPERVVLTNYATSAVRERCKALGAVEVFDKSTEIEKLVDWLASRVRH